VLGIDLPSEAVVHWSTDDWRNVHDTATADSGLGFHFADLDTATRKPGGAIVFTIHWSVQDRWEGVDYRLDVV
jgi:glucoamylase